MRLRWAVALATCAALVLGGCATVIDGAGSAADRIPRSTTPTTTDLSTDSVAPPATSNDDPEPIPSETPSQTLSETSTESPIPPVDPTTPLPPPSTTSQAAGSNVLNLPPFLGAAWVDANDYPGVVSEYGFTSPSGNIYCGFYDEGVVCQISEHDYTPPPKPAECGDTGWGTNFAVDDTGGGFLFCAGDLQGGGPSLEYGTAIGVGDYACVSREDGITCANGRDGGGFAVARAGYTLF